MTLLARMDRLVYSIGFDQVIFRKVQPRTLRWTPLLAIVALVAGYVLMTETVGRPNRAFFSGWLLFYGAYIAAALLRLFGPRLTPSALHPLDEREMATKMRAYAASGILLTGFTMLGCFYLSAAGLLGWWQPHSPNDWIALGFGVQAIAMLVPTLIVSWAEPRAVMDQDD